MMRKTSDEITKKIVRERNSGKISRRSFVLKMISIGAAAYLAPYLYRVISQKRDPEIFTEKEWELVEAVQEHLLPAGEDGPGASDINARPYLQWVLGDPEMDREEMEFIANGFGRVEAFALNKHGKSFLSMNTVEKENTLREVETTSWGEGFLSKVMLYIFEALLCDPVYNGNPEERGWNWLRHKPGLPRPTPETRYGA
jgi:hypothetical protein